MRIQKTIEFTTSDITGYESAVIQFDLVAYEYQDESGKFYEPDKIDNIWLCELKHNELDHRIQEQVENEIDYWIENNLQELFESQVGGCDEN